MDVQVVQVTAFGGPEVLVTAQAPDPTAGPGQAVVQTAAVDTGMLDLALRRAPSEWFDVTVPYVLGSGLAGTVREVGDGVDPSWVGRRVAVGLTGPSGAAAERVAVDAASLVAIPDGVDVTTAVSLVHDAVTALALLDDIPAGPGTRVLVTGANGGMGILLVQLLAAAGARVLGTARGAAKLDLVRAHGAEPVDVADRGWVERVRAEVDELDVVLDGVGGALGEAAFGLVADGGVFSAHGAPTGEFAEIDPDEAARRRVSLRGITDVQIPTERSVELLRRALAEVAAGRLRPVIGATFPLAEAAAAHAAIEDRSLLGKVVLVA